MTHKNIVIELADGYVQVIVTGYDYLIYNALSNKRLSSQHQHKYTDS